MEQQTWCEQKPDELTLRTHSRRGTMEKEIKGSANNKTHTMHRRNGNMIKDKKKAG